MISLKGKKVLVTGGSGFIPSHLCRKLVQEGAYVYIISKYNSIIDNIRLVDIWNKITCVEADLRNPDSLRQLQNIRPQIIFHFAAYNHVGDSFTHVSEAMNVNSLGTVHLLEAYDAYERFIYISSSEVYGYQESVPFHENLKPFPTSPYALGKYSGELYALMKWKVFKKPVVVLRPFNAFGPYQSPRAIIAEMIIKCLKGEDIVTTEGVQTRDFNYIENLVDGFMSASIEEAAIGEVINVGSGEEISIEKLVKKIHHMTGERSKLFIGKLDYRPTEIWRMCANHDKATQFLRWAPNISLDEGLKKTISWYKHFIALFDGEDSLLKKLCQTEIHDSSFK